MPTTVAGLFDGSLTVRAIGPGVLYGGVYPVAERTLFVRGGFYFVIVVTYAFLLIVVALTLREWFGYLVKLGRLAVRIFRK